MAIEEYYVNVVNPKTKRKNKVKSYRARGKIKIGEKYQSYSKSGFESFEEAADYEKALKKTRTLKTSNNMTFGELYQIYEMNHFPSLKDSTISVTKSHFKSNILPYWKDYRIEDIDKNSIKRWYHELKEKNLKDSSRNVYISKFYETFKFCYENEFISFMPPIVKFQKQRVQEVEKLHFYTLEEYRKFISVIDDVLDRAVFTTLYWCGLRKGELQALQWTDISTDFKSMKINKTYNRETKQITSPKTKNSNRTIILTQEVVDVLQELKTYYKVEDFPQKFIFGYNVPVTSNRIAKRNIKYANKSNLHRIRIHDFRHSHVTFLINNGVSAFDIAKRLGHSVEMVNNVYGHLMISSQERLANMIDQLANKT